LVAKQKKLPHGTVQFTATLADLIGLEVGAAAVFHSPPDTAS